MMENTIGISYGVLADKISEQLDKQGFKYKSRDIEVFENYRTALNSIKFSGLLSESVLGKSFQKLHKKVVSHVAKQNGKKVIN